MKPIADLLTSQSFTDRLYMLTFIAWRNLWRNKARSILTLSALGGGLAMLILYVALLDGMVAQMTNFSTNISSGHIQIHQRDFVQDQDLYATIPWSLIDELKRKNTDIAISPRLYAAGLASANETSGGVFLKAIDTQKESTVTTMLSHIRDGKNNLQKLSESDSDIEKYFVIVGAQIAKNMGLLPGSELVIITQAADGSIGNGIFIVSGILKPIEPVFDRTGVLLSIDAFNSLMVLESGAHELAIKIPNDQSLLSYKEKLIKEIDFLQNSHNDLKTESGLLVRSWKELLPAVSDMVEVSKAGILILGFIMIGLASLGMVNTIIMSIFERKLEFGILLSIGMGRYWLLLMVMLESLFTAIISSILGLIFGLSGAYYLEKYGIDLSNYMPDGFDYGGIIFEPVWRGQINSDSITLSMILMFIIAFIAALIPSWKTVRLKPIEVLH